MDYTNISADVTKLINEFVMKYSQYPTHLIIGREERYYMNKIMEDFESMGLTRYCNLEQENEFMGLKTIEVNQENRLQAVLI